MKLQLTVVLTAIFGLALHAQAQYVGANVNASASIGAYGSGQWGGMQSCPYNADSGLSDTYLDLKADEADLKAEKKDLKRDLKDVEKDVKYARKGIEDALDPMVSDAVIQHLEFPGNGPNSYTNACAGHANVNGSYQTNGRCSGAPGGADSGQVNTAEESDVEPFYSGSVGNSNESARSQNNSIAGSSIFCAKIHLAPKGSENKFVCKDVWKGNYALNGGRVSKNICSNRMYRLGGASSADISACKRGIDTFARLNKEKLEKEKRMADIDAEMARIKSEMREEKREMRRAARDGDTEGGYNFFCRDCNRGRRQGTLQTIGQIGIGALNSVLQYRTAQDAIQTNARLGWQSQGYMSSSPWPYAINGLAGVMGGTTGAYGCGAMHGGGGQYAMGPNGMMSPYGQNGMQMYDNSGGPFGYPQQWGNPYRNIGGGMYNPGMSPWGVPGPWGNQPGMMSPYFQGGNPAMSGNPMFQMGMNPFGNQFGNQFGNPFGNGNQFGNQFGNPLGGNQYQAQMMQQYQQQLQQYQQVQAQYYQQQQQKQMMVGQLQQELTRIQFQIQSIMSGSTLSTGFNAGFGTGASILPFPGTGSSFPTPGSSVTPTVRSR